MSRPEPALLAASLLVTLAWKISIHMAMVAGAVVILVLVFGRGALSLAPLAVLVGWARVAVQTTRRPDARGRSAGRPGRGERLVPAALARMRQ